MTKKNKDLLLGIGLDVVGYLSYLVPALGEGIDIVWAPLSAFILVKMYKGTMGYVGGAIELIEEALPFTDFIPTFTLMWFYKYILKKDDLNIPIEDDSNTPLEVEDKKIES